MRFLFTFIDGHSMDSVTAFEFYRANEIIEEGRKTFHKRMINIGRMMVHLINLLTFAYHSSKFPQKVPFCVAAQAELEPRGVLIKQLHGYRAF